MKLVIVAAVATLALVTMNTEASINTYIYSNTEYCQLTSGAENEMKLTAYSRKLGFTPTPAECRALLNTEKTAAISTEQETARQQLLRAQRGSVIRINTTLQQKLAALPAEERSSVLKRLFN